MTLAEKTRSAYNKSIINLALLKIDEDSYKGKRQSKIVFLDKGNIEDIIKHLDKEGFDSKISKNIFTRKNNAHC